MVQYKANQLQVKDVDSSKGIVQAYYSAYGNLDSDGDIIVKGAATKSAKERGPGGTNRIKHFKNHKSEMVPGVLLELGEDERGGWFVSKLAQYNGEFTQLAKDTLIEYQSGVITEHSHMLEPVKSYKDDKGNNVITELKLWEVSTLTAWGANEQTPTISVKSAKDYIEMLDKLERLVKIGEFSDTYLASIEAKIKEIQSLINPEPPAHSENNEPITFDIVKLFNQLEIQKNGK